MSRAHHTDIRFPHPARCIDCSALGLCSLCGLPATASECCGNGRCVPCHQAVCSPGSPMRGPHGIGTPGAAELQAVMRAHGRLPRNFIIPEERAASAVCQRLVALGSRFICEQRDLVWHFTIDTEDK